MERQTQIRDLIRQHELNGLAEALALETAEINLPLIERLKKEVDVQIRTDARRALQLATFTRQYAQFTPDLCARALGARAQAQALHVNGRYAEALEQYEAARRLYAQTEQPVEAARVARAMVDALMYLGRYEEALELAAQARAVFETKGEDLLAAQLATNVGNIYHRLDQNHAALECYERARPVFTAAHDQLALATLALNSANVHSNLDDFRQAEDLYEQAYSLYAEQGRTQAALHAKYSIGYLRFLKGHYHQAMRVLHATAAEAESNGDEWLRALCELDLAEIYLQLNAHQEAAPLAQRARERFVALGLRYEAAKALTFAGLAQLQQLQLDGAERLLQQARQEFVTEGNEVYQGLLDVYLAELALERGQAGAALRLATEAERCFAEQELKTKTCYAQLVAARAWLLSGQAAQARELTERTLENCRTLEAPWLAAQSHELLGDLLVAEDQPQHAYEQYTHAVASIERIRGSIRVDEFRSAFFKNKLGVFEKLIRLCLQNGDAEGDAKAFFFLESRKARTLVDLLVNELEPAPSGAPQTDQGLYQRWQQLREELHWYYSKLSRNDANDQRRRLALDERLRTEIQTRELALTELARQAQVHDPDFDWLHNLAGLSVSEVQAVLAADEALIEYYFDEEELKIFVIDRQSATVAHSPGQRGALKELIAELKFQFEKFNYGTAYFSTHQEQLLRSLNACLHELHQALFAPVAARVAGRKLIFIPFDFLHSVPFQALYDGTEYLLDRHEMVFAPSARLYAWAASKPAPKRDRALILGAADAVAPQITAEIEAIRQLFPDGHCLTGADATLTQLAALASESNLLHIASHAIFRQDNPLFSALKLADGWLNFYDICALHLPGSLVTLSGCSTGANRVLAGDELLGLVRGFLMAGATTLVVSLWAVHDQATAHLMTAFYQRLQAGVAPRPALREAALATRHEYPHPYFWAPFVLIGRN
ncbi:MAG: CHAT domain-containing protein [Acidobacteria bacterium]|nr:CHAT domain-containing protein [Acidobacteriota bacterium]MBI3422382.1 CHAT domain-containing protein [Acidobacteriota bacterium]